MPETEWLSRFQFAWTVGFHILFPTLTLGLSAWLVVLESLWLRTGDPVWGRARAFWQKVFALGFGMGVVTGVVLSYEIGTNFGPFAEATGNVLGPMMSLEVLTAFFLEASFLGLMLLGPERAGKRLHLFSTVMVAVGAHLSAFWILAANSWMHTPAGYELSEGVFRISDWWAAVLNPSLPWRLSHMLNASYLSAGFVVAGFSAWHLLKGRDPQTARRSLRLILPALALLAPLQLLLGDQHGLNTLEHQPIKVAAMEGHWESKPGAPFVVLAWPDQAAAENRGALEIPYLGSLLLHHDPHAEVTGLRSVPPQDRPLVAPVFFAFRLMVGIGLLMIGLAWLSAWKRHRGRLEEGRGLLRALWLASPLGFFAVLAGWVTTEMGRQPWVVNGLMRTSDAVAPIPAGDVRFSLFMFVGVYLVLLAAFLTALGHILRKGTAGAAQGGELLMFDLPLFMAMVIAFGVTLYVLLDGFDLGVGIFSGLVEDEADRGRLLASIAPVWDGNETWLVLGGVMLFAAFPPAYNQLLGHFYLPVLVMVASLILRGVVFELREHAWSVRLWDRLFFLGSLVAAFCQGLILGGFVEGQPPGGPLLTPFSLFTGVAVVLAYSLLGACWLLWRLEGELQARARRMAAPLVWIVGACLIAVSVWTALHTPEVAARWSEQPYFGLLSAMAALALMAFWRLWIQVRVRHDLWPWLTAVIFYLLSLGGLAVSHWPYVVPFELTIWEAAADPESLRILAIAITVTLPVVLAASVHAYRVFLLDGHKASQ